MENFDLFLEAAGLLRYAANLHESMRIGENGKIIRDEWYEFSHFCIEIIHSFRSFKSLGAVQFNDDQIPTWWTTIEDREYVLMYMPCVGEKSGIIRIYKQSGYKKLAYMVFVKEGAVSIKKYTGVKVDDADACPDWEY